MEKYSNTGYFCYFTCVSIRQEKWVEISIYENPVYQGPASWAAVSQAKFSTFIKRLLGSAVAQSAKLRLNANYILLNNGNLIKLMHLQFTFLIPFDLFRVLGGSQFALPAQVSFCAGTQGFPASAWKGHLSMLKVCEPSIAALPLLTSKMIGPDSI